MPNNHKGSLLAAYVRAIAAWCAVESDAAGRNDEKDTIEIMLDGSNSIAGVKMTGAPQGFRHS